MACQSCLDKRRAILGAVGLSSLQSMVPLTLRDQLASKLSPALSVKAFPINVPVAGHHPRRHIVDIAFQKNKVAIDAGYQKLNSDRLHVMHDDLFRVGWVFLRFTPSYLEDHMEKAVEEIRAYL